MIAALDNQLGAIAFDKNGQLYGIDRLELYIRLIKHPEV